MHICIHICGLLCSRVLHNRELPVLQKCEYLPGSGLAYTAKVYGVLGKSYDLKVTLKR
ncbi:hypothetical protein PISMIDRAFT_676757 [Pisolithus microcarpus 441]|uniref:Uncharacterized protein n=1 Tax=Pisolithus microcarpus 441 TaxID=765257 RepID=A0A0C9Z938_9AGAM|nr:hypothetical protein PISMIDRAFT_676757 [Pisolithus microcarpus 441]